jgi:hypothetical protein
MRGLALSLQLPVFLLLLAGCQSQGFVTEQSGGGLSLKAGRLKVDQSNQVGGPDGQSISCTNVALGQTFGTNANSITQVDLSFLINNVPAGGNPTTIGLHEDITQAPLATASVTIAPPAPGELFRVVSYTFSPAVPVTKGRTYTISCTGAGNASWQVALTDPYARGEAVQFDGTPLTGADFWFVTYSSK